MILLHELPRGHELRTRPLVNAQCRNKHSKTWRDITPTWGIAKACYDDLSEAWTDGTEFRVLPDQN